MNIGVIGGGQLAQMLAQAGESMDMRFAFLSPDNDACAAAYGLHLPYSYQDQQAKALLEEWSDVITYEFENIPADTVKALEQTLSVHPSSSALVTACDRLNEKKLFGYLDIATARHSAVSSLEDLKTATAKTNYPCILKTRREGYDGKGQFVLKDDADIKTAWEAVGKVPCILEAMVNFSREVSIIAARNANDEISVYPLTENTHREGILRLSLSLQDDPLQQQAEALIKKVLREMQYVGVLAIELFDTPEGIVANELSPRVHNSGHWTMDGASVSQFQNHLMAITNQALQPVLVEKPTAMVNLIGQMPTKESIEQIPGAVLYDYGKAIRPGRKVGHVNITSSSSRTHDWDSIKAALKMTGEDQLAEKINNNEIK